MKWMSLLLAVMMIFGGMTPAMAHDGDGLGYGNDPGEFLLLPFKVAYDIITLPIFILGGILGGSHYSRGPGSWYTPSHDNSLNGY